MVNIVLSGLKIAKNDPYRKKYKIFPIKIPSES